MATNAQPFTNEILTAQKEGETIKDLVRRHLTDESHTTSDEELKNVRLSLYKIDELEEGFSLSN